MEKKTVKMPDPQRNPLVTLQFVTAVREWAADAEKVAVEQGRVAQFRTTKLTVNSYLGALEARANAKLAASGADG